MAAQKLWQGTGHGLVGVPWQQQHLHATQTYLSSISRYKVLKRCERYLTSPIWQSITKALSLQFVARHNQKRPQICGSRRIMLFWNINHFSLVSSATDTVRWVEHVLANEQTRGNFDSWGKIFACNFSCKYQTAVNTKNHIDRQPRISWA